MKAEGSSWCLLGAPFPGYLGCLWSRRVLGLPKVGDVWIFFVWLWTPFSTVFFALKAFALASALGGVGASFFALGAIFMKRVWLFSS